jgi:uncharacterized protein CbrC (UPF0167 family)
MTTCKFGKGFIAGVVTALLILALAVVIFIKHGGKNEIEEKQAEIEQLQNEYRNRDAVDFINDIPAVRASADGQAGEFNRKLERILQRFGSGKTD